MKNVEESQDAEMMVKNFKKYEGLFGSNREALRLAETFGHEAGHAVFALDNTADAVRDEKLRAQNEIDRNALPKKNRYPLPPDLEQRMTVAQQFHDRTELYAQQQEKIINGELRAFEKFKK